MCLCSSGSICTRRLGRWRGLEVGWRVWLKANVCCWCEGDTVGFCVMLPSDPPMGMIPLMCGEREVTMGWEEVGCCPVGLMTKVWGELIELKLWMVGLMPGWGVEVTMPLRMVDLLANLRNC